MITTPPAVRPIPCSQDIGGGSLRTNDPIPPAGPIIIGHDAFLLFELALNTEDRSYEQTIRLTSILF
jgi:hypothetical protein